MRWVTVLLAAGLSVGGYLWGRAALDRIMQPGVYRNCFKDAHFDREDGDQPD